MSFIRQVSAIRSSLGIVGKRRVDLQPVAVRLLVIAGQQRHRLGAGHLHQPWQRRQRRLGVVEEGAKMLASRP
jgi:hypothetical protein